MLAISCGMNVKGQRKPSRRVWVREREVVNGRILVVFACDQRRVSAIFAQASLSRLGESCRVLCLGIGSPFSPRRLGIGVERITSRSGERRSPKRDRDVTWGFWAWIPVQARSLLCWANHGLAQARRSRLSEM